MQKCEKFSGLTGEFDEIKHVSRCIDLSGRV
jgi:hypothetical protein